MLQDEFLVSKNRSASKLAEFSQIELVAGRIVARTIPLPSSGLSPAIAQEADRLRKIPAKPNVRATARTTAMKSFDTAENEPKQVCRMLYD